MIGVFAMYIWGVHILKIKPISEHKLNYIKKNIHKYKKQENIEDEFNEMLEMQDGMLTEQQFHRIKEYIKKKVLTK